MFDVTSYVYFLFIWSILYDRLSSSLSWIGHTSKGKFAKSSEAEQHQQRAEVQQLPLRAARYVFCMWMPMQWIEYRWSGDEGSSPRGSNPGSPPHAPSSSSLPSPPPPPLRFNLCRQGRHQSEWQVVWSSLQAWREKGRCQHKYPSRIHGGHGAATATMNLHPLSQAGKHEAHQHGWKNKKAPSSHHHHHHPLHKQTELPVYSRRVDCLLIFIFPLGRHSIQWIYTEKKFKNGLKTWSRFSSKGLRCMKWDRKWVCAVFYILPPAGIQHWWKQHLVY